MGFWHTGYIEFHEPAGLGNFTFKPRPLRYSCPLCGLFFDTSDDVRKHRFEQHPLRRPTLSLSGREVGAHPARITQSLRVAEIDVDADEVFLNGRAVAIRDVPRKLARLTSDVHRLVLNKGGVAAEFTLDVRIASARDLRGIEAAFERMAKGRYLDTRAIDDFISATKKFSSTIGYCDGVCSYLYGVLAKERSSSSSLPYEAYVGKYNKAAEELAPYDRPLACMVGSLIAFHFNHFEDAARLGRGARVGSAAARYAAWLQRKSDDRFTAMTTMNAPEVLVTDRETEQIIQWAMLPFTELSKHASDLESFLTKDISEYDRVKLHVLSGEMYAASSDYGKAVAHAKRLRNLSALEQWAESMINAQQKERHE